MAAVDLFLEIDGIAGESADNRHAGAIDALAFSWAEHVQVGSGGGGGGGVGKVSIGDLQVVMRTSIASPLLFLACASGKHHVTAKLSARRRGQKAGKDHLVITLHDVLVTSYRVGANESGEDDTPTDQASLGFRRVEFEVSAESPKGGAGKVVKTGWDVAANKPLTPAAATSRRRKAAG